MPKVCQDMYKCHNYHAILHKLYMWFGNYELRLYLNRAKISLIRGRPPPPLNTPMMGMLGWRGEKGLSHKEEERDEGVEQGRRPINP